ncbi:MAG: transposase family protein [Psychromonas sp.]|nr:transposase family protein [Psychromonas sp.]
MTQPNKEHKKYSYKIRGLNISNVNQGCGNDITYKKINGGLVYIPAVIGWGSKAVLSHKISNTMDCASVMNVLDPALSAYEKPEIFNTDQGSQYISDVHTQRLKKNDLIIMHLAVESTLIKENPYKNNVAEKCKKQIGIKNSDLRYCVANI